MSGEVRSEISFPVVPSGIDDELRSYLLRINEILQDSLTGKAFAVPEEATTITNQGALATLDTVDSAQIDDDAIVESKILNGVVVEGKLADAAVVEAKIAMNAVVEAKLANYAVTSIKILDTAVTTEKIAALAIETNKLAANAVIASKISVASLGAIEATLGTVLAGIITGTTITGGTIRTAVSGRRVVIDSSGIKFMSASPASGKIGTTANGGDNIVIGTTGNGGDNEIIGTGYYARFYNVDNGVAFYVQSEQTVASIHLFNRSSTPSGGAEEGDLSVIQGKLYICTASGTPGTWTVVGTQT